MRQGACAIRAVPAYPNLGKSISLCVSVQVHFSSNLSRFGVEPRGSSGEMPFVGSCALFTSCRAGMPVTALTGTWAEAEACFLFSGSRWLCAFPGQSQLCCALQLGSRTAARSGIGPTVFGQVLLLL